MASYVPNISGGQGDASVGGAIAGLALGSKADDKLVPRYGSDLLNNRYNAYIRQFFQPAAERQIWEDYAKAYSGNNAAAAENAKLYGDWAKSILGDTTRSEDVYGSLRAGNLAALGDVYKNVLDYGLAGQKARLAAGGYGNAGPSSYDKILSSTLMASNLSPVLQTIFAGLGPAAANAFAQNKSWDQYRLAQFQNDPLTGYVDASTAGRVINPLLLRQGFVGGDIANLGRIGQGIAQNIQGYDLRPGLTSRLNNFMGATRNALSFTGDLMGTFGGGAMGGAGGMGGFGGGGGMGGMNPQMLQQLAPIVRQMMQNYGANPTVTYNPSAAYSTPYSGGVDTPYTGDTYLNSPALAYV